MKHLRLRPRFQLLAISALCVFAPATFAADQLAAGAVVPAIEAQDQHEKSFTLEDGTEYLLVAFDMGTGKAANRWLAEKGAAFLPEHHAVFVSNIHGMPGVGRMFALPKMRKYPHRIILADKEGLLDAFPKQDGKVTVLKLKPGLVVESVTFWSPKDDRAPF